MYTLYILYSESFDRFYVGYTNDLERRLPEHNRKKGKFTDAGIPWKLVYSESFTLKRMQWQEKNLSKHENLKSLSKN